jgi:SAM-dependent methyltransferase
MHDQAYEWVASYAHLVPAGSVVLEMGARNINGTIRGLFPTVAEWTALDITDGPEIDVVADAADYDGGPYDAIVSCELLEHAERAQEIVWNMGRLVNKGGVLILTCAGTGRRRHGQHGAEAPACDEWYRNVSGDELLGWLGEAGFVTVLIDEDPEAADTRCVAWKG